MSTMTPEERDRWLRRLAAQLVIMLPEDERDSLTALDYARELVAWTAKRPEAGDPQPGNLVRFGPRST